MMHDNDTNSGFRMADVGGKAVTFRRARARGSLSLGAEAFQKVVNRQVPKGDVLRLAEVAGIQAAKKASDWLPLCHPLLIERVLVTLVTQWESQTIEVEAEVSGEGKTGYEMEAMTAVSAALLCAYDLLKPIDPTLTLNEIRLAEKEGGKSGHWFHPKEIPRSQRALPVQTGWEGRCCASLIVSDRVASGVRADGCAPVIREFLETRGARVLDSLVVSDDKDLIASALKRLLCVERIELIVVSGGTGVGPRDVTPEVLEAVCDRLIPGIGERLRSEGAIHTSMSWLSRSVAGQVGKTMVVALPGSPKAVAEGLSTLDSLLPHALAMVAGGNHG